MQSIEHSSLSTALARAAQWLSLLFNVTLLHEKVNFRLCLTYMKYWSPGDFFVFYKKNLCLNNKIIRAFADTHIHIPNMYRHTCYHMLCICYVHFGAFSMVNLALQCTKK